MYNTQDVLTYICYVLHTGVLAYYHIYIYMYIICIFTLYMYSGLVHVRTYRFDPHDDATKHVLNKNSLMPSHKPSHAHKAQYPHHDARISRCSSEAPAT